MNFHEWPLILFTVLTQSAVGAFAWCFVTLMFVRLPDDQQISLKRSTAVIWVLMAIASLLSLMHLGSPMRAMNSLLRAGQAPLSNEIVFAAAFTVLTFVHWFLCARQAGSGMIGKLLLLLALICGVLLIWNTAAIYMMPTVPTWDTPLTPLSFVLTAVIGGSALAAVLFVNAGIVEPPLLRRGIMLVAGLAVLVAIGAAFSQALSLTTMHSSMKSTTTMLAGYNCLMTTRFVLLVIAMGLWVRQTMRYNPLQGAKSQSMCLAVICSVLILLAELVGRTVFYSLHMTPGMV